MKVLTNPFCTDGTLDALTLRHASYLDQAVRTTSDVEFKSLALDSLVVTGSTSLMGVVTQIETETLNIKDNIIVINDQNNSILRAGFQIYRGPSLPTFDLIYDETTLELKAGFSSSTSLLPIALREETPIDNGFTVWNAASQRFVTRTDLPGSISFSGSISVNDFIEASRIQSSTTDMVIQSVGNLTLSSTNGGGDIIIPKTNRIRLGDTASIMTDAQNRLLASLGTLHLTSGDSFAWSDNSSIYGVSNSNQIYIDSPEIHLRATDVIYFETQSPFQHSNTVFTPYSNLYEIACPTRLFLNSSYTTTSNDVVLSSLAVGTATENGIAIRVDNTTLQPSIIADTVNVTGDWKWAQNRNIMLGSAKIENTNTTDLVITAPDGLILSGEHVDFTKNKPVNFGLFSSIKETMSDELVIANSAGPILLSPLNSIRIDDGKSMAFGTAGYITTSNTTSFVLHAQSDMFLDSPLVRVKDVLQFGNTSNSSIFKDGLTNNIVIKSTHGIVLDCPDGFSFGNTLLLGDCTISSTTSNLVLYSPSQITTEQPFIVTNTTASAITSMGGLVVAKDVVSEGNILSNSALIVHDNTTSTNVVSILSPAQQPVSSDGPPLVIQNASTTSGAGIVLKTRWDSLHNYTIGRGTLLLNGGRCMSFTIPEYATYVTGNKPQFLWGSMSRSATNDVSYVYMTLDEDALTIDPNVTLFGQNAMLAGTCEFNSGVCTAGMTISNSTFDDTNVLIRPTTTFKVNTTTCTFSDVDDEKKMLEIDAIKSTMFVDTEFTENVTIDKILQVNSTSTFNNVLSAQNGIAMNMTKITNMANPENDQDAATKIYVDGITNGMSVKMAVACSTTNDIDLTQPVAANIDDVAVTAIGTRVLVQFQFDPIENGIYEKSDTGHLVRADDMAVGSRADGASVFVSAGTLYGAVGYVVIGAADIIVGTDDIQFTAFSGASSVIAGNGLVKSGNTFSADLNATTMAFDAQNKITINPTFLSSDTLQIVNGTLHTSSYQTHVNALGTITTGEWRATVLDVAYGGSGCSSQPANSILIGNSTLPTLAYNDFVYSSATKFLGIGTATPQSQLHISSNLANIQASNPTGTWITLEAATPQNAIGVRFKNSSYINDFSMNADGYSVIKTTSGLQVSANGSNVLTATQSACQSLVSFDAPQIRAPRLISSETIQWNSGTLSSPTSNSTLITSDLVQMSGNLQVLGATASLGSNIVFHTDTNSCSITGQDMTFALNDDAIASLILYDSGVIMPKGLVFASSTVDAATKNITIDFDENVDSLIISAIDNNNSKVEINMPTWMRNDLYLTTPSAAATTNYLRLHAMANEDDVYSFQSLSSSSSSTLNFGKGGDSEMIVQFTDIAGTKGVVFDPVESTFSVSQNVDTVISGDLIIANALYSRVGNKVSATFPYAGWYYVGKLETSGRTVLETTSWKWTITFDSNSTTYTSKLLLYDRAASAAVASGIIYKTTDPVTEYHLFIKVNATQGGIHCAVVESVQQFSLVGLYEGNAVVPDATYSGYDMIGTWTIDYTTESAQASQPLEIGTLAVAQSSTLNQTTFIGSSVFQGTATFQQPCTFSDLNIYDANTVAELAQLTNQLTLYSQNIRDAGLVLKSTSSDITNTATATVTLDSDDTKHLVLAHLTNDSGSGIDLLTRNTLRCRIDDSGITTFTSSIDDQVASILQQQGIAAFVVNGGALFNRSVRVLENVYVGDTLQLGQRVSIQAITGTLDNKIWFNDAQLSGIAEVPVDATDAVSKAYVDSLLQGITTKQAVNVATTEPIVDLISPNVIDGVAMSDGDRVLVKDQINPVENGIYVISLGNAMIRASDFDINYHAAGTYIFINEGNVSNNAGFICSSVSGTDVVGVNAITFSQFSGAGQIQAGNGILKNGNILSVNYSPVDFNLSSTSSKHLQINSAILGTGLSGGNGSQINVSSITHLDRVGTLVGGTWRANTIAMEYGGTGSTAFAAGRVVFSTGTALTQGRLYFDSTNQRLGINTFTPTSGLTMADRDVEIYQSTSLQTPQLLFSSATTNFSYAMYNNNTGSFVWTAGIGTQKTGLSKIMELSPYALAMTNGKMKANAFELPTSVIRDGYITTTTTGPYNLSLFASDNSSGTSLSLYGGLGTASNTSHSEYLKIGYDATSLSFNINTMASGVGVQRDLSLMDDYIVIKPQEAVVDINAVTALNINSEVVHVNGSGGILCNSGPITTTQPINVGSLMCSGVAQINGNVELAHHVLTSSTASSILGMQVDPGYVMLVASTVDPLNSGNTNVHGSGITFSSLRTANEGFRANYTVVFETDEEEILTIEPLTADTTAARSVVLSSVKDIKQIELLSSENINLNGNVVIADNLNISGALETNGAITCKSTLYSENNRFKTANISTALYISDLSTLHRRTVTFDSATSGLLVDGNLNLNNTILFKPTSLPYPCVDVLQQQGFDIKLDGTTLVSITNDEILFNAPATTHVAANLVVDSGITASTISCNECTISTGMSVNGVFRFSGNTLSSLNVNEPVVFDFSSSTSPFTSLSPSWTWTGTQFNINPTSSVDVASVFVFDVQQRIFDCGQGSGRITGLSTPIIGADAANKAYVDNLVKGLNLKAAVDVATIAEIDLSGAVLYIDDVELNLGMRVLVMNQSQATENGIYEVQSSKLLTRATDFASGAHVAGAFTFVQRGTVHAETGYVCISDFPNDVVGVDELLFTQFNGNVISAGNGLYKDNNNVMNVGIATNSLLTLVGNKLSIDSNGIGSGLNFNNGILELAPITQVDTIISGNWNASPIDVAYGGTGVTGFAIDNAVLFSKNNIVNSATSLTFVDNKSLQVVGDGALILNSDNYETNSLQVSRGDICVSGDYGALAFRSGEGTYNWMLKRRQADPNRLADNIPSLPWISVYASNYGMVIVAISDPVLTPNGVATFYISVDGGFTWNGKFASVNNNSWEEVALSNDGQYIVACTPQSSLFVSQDYGETFTAKLTDFDRFWEWCSVSDNTGQYMLASSLGDGVYLSSDYGTNWTYILPTDVTDAGFVRVTRTGDVMLVGYYPDGALMRSDDYGVTWSTITAGLRETGGGNYYDAFESLGSNVIVMFENPGSLWISSDRGLTWNERMADTARNWIDMSVSEDGSVIGAVVEQNGLAYLSTDSGQTFTQVIDSTLRPWTFISVTRSKNAVFLGGKNIPVYKLSPAPDFQTVDIISDGNVNVNSASLGFDGEALVYAIVDGKVRMYISVPTSNLVIGCGNAADKTGLNDLIVITEYGQMGVGYSNATSGDISYTVDVLGNLRVSEDVSFTTALPVSSGGTGTSSFPAGSGVIVSEDGGQTLTSKNLTTVNGAVVVGTGSGLIVDSGASLRSRLGLSIGTDIQAYSSKLASLNSINTDKALLYYDGTTSSFAAAAITQTSSNIVTINSDVVINGTISSTGTSSTSSSTLLFSNLVNITTTVTQKRCRIAKLPGSMTVYATLEFSADDINSDCEIEIEIPSYTNIFTTTTDATIYTALHEQGSTSIINCSTIIGSSHLLVHVGGLVSNNVVLFLIIDLDQ